MIRVRIKPERLTPDGRRNEGGRRLSEKETPEGMGAADPGETIEVPREWYELRQHWHFLEVVQEKGGQQGAEASTLEDDGPVNLDDLSYAELQQLAKSEGLSGAGGADDLRTRLREHFASVEE